MTYIESPVSLNSNQIRILDAIKKEDDCKYINVTGPPGTGKTHTIIGIIFDIIKNNKSVLILSDKIEALHVIESKLLQILKDVT